MKDVVSVVVPTYNRDYVLGRALDSLRAQTHKNLEIIVVDDGSTDGTRALMQKHYADDPRVRYVYQENRGVSAARNRGLQEASGNYIALLDSDDVWKPWKLELQLHCLAQSPGAGMIWTDMEAIDPSGRIFDPAYLHTMYTTYHWFKTEDLFDRIRPVVQTWPDAPGELREVNVHSGDIYSQMIMGNLVHTSTVLLTRDRFEKVGLFREDLRVSGEDYDFHLRTCRAGRVAFVNVASIQYQTGMSDRLTRHEYSIHMAQNLLKTIVPAIERDRSRIHLPEHMIESVLSGAHAWMGEASFETGDYATARSHLLRSLAINPWQTRSAGIFALSLFPEALSAALLKAYRSAKSIFPRNSMATPVNHSGK